MSSVPQQPPIRRILGREAPPRYQIQEMLSNSMEDLTMEDKNLIKIVRKYKVVNKTELEKLSKAFGNVL
jgi:hypothetical protein